MKVTVEITHTQHCVIPSAAVRRHSGFEPLEIGTELGLIRARKLGPNPKIEVKPHVSAEPSLHEGLLVREWVAKCGIVIADLLAEFSEPPPFLLADIGIDMPRAWTRHSAAHQ